MHSCPHLGAASECVHGWHHSSPLVASRASAPLHDPPVVTRERVGIHLGRRCARKRYLDPPLDNGWGAGAREDSGHEVQPSVGSGRPSPPQEEMHAPPRPSLVQQHFVERDGRNPVHGSAPLHARLRKHQLRVRWRNGLCQPLKWHVVGVHSHRMRRLLQGEPRGR